MLPYEEMTKEGRWFYDQIQKTHGVLHLDQSYANREIAVIAEVLKVNTTVTDLNLFLNDIRDDEAQAIAEVLRVNTTLCSIDLRINHIGDAGAQSISEALKVNTALAELDLWKNEIGDAGAQAFAEVLKVTKTLAHLDLSLNRIGDAGAQAIAEALKVNTTLKKLYLSWNQIGEAGAQAIAEALKVNTTLTILVLSGNSRIGPTGAQAIAEALKVNTTVTKLELTGTSLGKAGVQAIDEACKVSGTLTDLDLRDQINPLVFSLIPRCASADDIQAVFLMLTSGLELESQSAALPPLPAELAELIMNEAYYWQGIMNIKRPLFDEDDHELEYEDENVDSDLEIVVPRSVNGSSIRVQAIQVLWDWRNRPDISDDDDDNCLTLVVKNERSETQYRCDLSPTFVDSNTELATFLPASNPIFRQIPKGWKITAYYSFSDGSDVRCASLYVGYI